MAATARQAALRDHPRVRAAGRAVRRRLPGPVRGVLRAVRSRWRRSLQLRVLAATLVLGLAVILGVGQFVLARVGDGLVSSRIEGVTVESSQLYDQARRGYETANLTNSRGFSAFLQTLVAQLGGPAERDARFVIAIKARGTATDVLDRASRGIDPTAVPQGLRTQVARGGGVQRGQLLTVPIRGDDGTIRDVSAIAVGGLIDFGGIGGGNWELYFVYPLDRELGDLDLVRRTFGVGGLALLLLVGAVALVVTRQVVAPVRQAARTAEELASGRLDRRMRVRGEDDLARLGRGFNAMASSLERQILQLRELSRVQRRFVSDVSHELRTPLTTIRMAGEVLHEARDDFDPAIARTAELLQTQLDRFESLLADLLEVSRFDAGAAVLETEAADVGEIAVRVVEGLRPLADLKGSRADVLVPSRGCVAEVEPGRVERILRNLVANALEHGEGRPVVVTVAGDDTAVAVGVRDHGVGLRPGELRMVFNRFWRADPARARSTGGTGLGLAIALEDAHLHGGTLQVWGEPGGGAHFLLTLPRQAAGVLAGSPLPLVPSDALRPTPGPAPEQAPGPAPEASVPGTLVTSGAAGAAGRAGATGADLAREAAGDPA